MRVIFSKNLAFISKPRCASTSLRRLLDKFLSDENGDFGVDVADQKPPFHPHVTAPYLRELIATNFPGQAALEFFICIRHPVMMLHSYYKFFAPDRFSRYNYQPGYSGCAELTFEEWIIHGRVGMNPNWARLAPKWISTDNLSPLCFEAHAFDANCLCNVDKVFCIEEPGEMLSWLSSKLGRDLELNHLNGSRHESTPLLGTECLEKVRIMFPFESGRYGL